MSGGHEEGNRLLAAYRLNRDTDHPRVHTMYEQFKSIQAIENHLKEKHTETLLKAMSR